MWVLVAFTFIPSYLILCNDAHMTGGTGAAYNMVRVIPYATTDPYTRWMLTFKLNEYWLNTNDSLAMMSFTCSAVGTVVCGENKQECEIELYICISSTSLVWVWIWHYCNFFETVILLAIKE